jgi:hypothetical protein
VWKSRLEGSWKHDDRDMDWTEFDHRTIKCVLSFVYTGDYDLDSTKIVTSSCIQEETKTLEHDDEIIKSCELYFILFFGREYLQILSHS